VLFSKCYYGEQIKDRVVVRMFGMYGEKTSAYRVLVRKPEGNGLLRRPRLRWESHIRIILKQTYKWTGLMWLRTGTGGRLL
jgi:hypothetical protein